MMNINGMTETRRRITANRRHLLIGLLLPFCGLIPSLACAAESRLQINILTKSLQQPWALAFLPDKTMLISEKSGQLVQVSAEGVVLQRISILPAVAVEGQGGLLDLALHPDYPKQPWLYWTFSEADAAGNIGTALARGRFENNKLSDSAVLYRQTPKVSGGHHFGSRLAFDRQGHVFVSFGDRGKMAPAQALDTSIGKIIRLNLDGSIPEDNPFVRQKNRLPEIWSLGHRNAQGLIYDQKTNTLWNHEHGPRGGDEINLVVKGQNYGWPEVSYGCPYTSPLPKGFCEIGNATHAPKYTEPVSIWVPSVAPSGMMIYRHTYFNQWQGDIFMGALAGKALWRVRILAGKEVEREALLKDLHQRIRDVRHSPEGLIYVLTDDGWLVRLQAQE